MMHWSWLATSSLYFRYFLYRESLVPVSVLVGSGSGASSTVTVHSAV